MISRISELAFSGADGVAIVVVRPHGELDLASIASLDSAVRSALAAAGPVPRLVADLSRVSLLQPVVLGVLLDARRRCSKAGGAFALVVNEPQVSAVLADAEVESLFDIVEEMPEAIAHLSSR
ncbi:MAG: STAS domain-containing protein [Acidimicrobiaceae bacterium]|nr:STAS domain-containing protein [Acidimicrobiaceae bacterium]